MQIPLFCIIFSAYAPVPSSLAVAFAAAGGIPDSDEVHCNSNQQYVVPHSVYCDRFYACDNGTPVMYQCEDGYGYHVEKQECKYLHLVKCGTRKKLRKFNILSS
uniref:Chitin-binding type-2 domain-containing protein n=1 Tax=Cacopsylla melanoneura TaxID=428564 RepID=A0A8D8Z957_9HEMI